MCWNEGVRPVKMSSARMYLLVHPSPILAQASVRNDSPFVKDTRTGIKVQDFIDMVMLRKSIRALRSSLWFFIPLGDAKQIKQNRKPTSML